MAIVIKENFLTPEEIADVLARHPVADDLG